MVTQSSYVANGSYNFAINDNLLKLYSILVIDSNRRNTLFISMKMFVMKRTILSKSEHIVLRHHQVNNLTVLLNDSGLVAVLLIIGFAYLHINPSGKLL